MVPAIALQTLTQQSGATSTPTQNHIPTHSSSTQSTPVQSQQHTSNVLDPAIQTNLPHATATHTSGTSSNVSNASASSHSTSTTTPPVVQSNSTSSPALPQQQAATQNQNVPPTPNLSLPANVGPSRRSNRSFFLYWLRPLIALVVYVVTLGITTTASRRNTLLGLVNGSWGTWFIAILAKAGDLAFAFAVLEAFDCLAWSRLRKAQMGGAQQGHNGTRLDWFLAMVSSTGIFGLIMIFCRSVRSLRRRQTASTVPNVGFVKKRLERWKRSETARWSLARVLFIVILIPGPGIILLGKCLISRLLPSFQSLLSRQRILNRNKCSWKHAVWMFQPALRSLSQISPQPSAS